jgi:hypothetical protein
LRSNVFSICDSMLKASKIGSRTLVELDPARQLRRHVLEVALDLGERLLVVDDHLVDVVGEQVADQARGHLQLAVDHRGRRTVVALRLDLGPQLVRYFTSAAKSVSLLPSPACGRSARRPLGLRSAMIALIRWRSVRSSIRRETPTWLDPGISTQNRPAG